jgi:hypothetical protein
MAQPDCVIPIAFPRCSAGHVSATRTVPADHSAPSPNPTSERHNSNSANEWDVAIIAVKIEYVRIEPISTRVRPNRSASTPANVPPSAAAASVTVVSVPACAPVSPNSFCIESSAKE